MAKSLLLSPAVTDTPPVVAQETTQRRRGARRKLAVLLLGFVLALFAAEAAVRVRSYIRYGPVDDIYDLYEWHPEARIRVPIPNTSVVIARRSQIDIDSRGFRNPEVEHPKPQDTIRLAFLGGSTTFCGEVKGNAQTWAHLVAQGLAEAYSEARFDYINAGVTGARIEDSIQSLELRVKAMDPDVIVIYHATNDLAVDSKELAIAAGLAEKHPPPNWLQRHSQLWELTLKNLRWSRAQSTGADQNDKLDYDPVALAQGAFQERLTRLVRNAQEVADVVVVITFTTKTRREQPLEEQLENLEQSFQFMPYFSPEGSLQGYEAYNDVIRTVAAETGALLVDGEYELPGDSEHFKDSVHFTDLGSEAMAQRVLARLQGAAPLEELIEARSSK